MCPQKAKAISPCWSNIGPSVTRFKCLSHERAVGEAAMVFGGPLGWRRPLQLVIITEEDQVGVAVSGRRVRAWSASTSRTASSHAGKALKHDRYRIQHSSCTDWWSRRDVLQSALTREGETESYGKNQSHYKSLHHPVFDSVVRLAPARPICILNGAKPGEDGHANERVASRPSVCYSDL